jgi:Na+:H+ antiporter, NhaA family
VSARPPSGGAGRRRTRSPWAGSDRPIPRRLIQPLQDFLHLEASGAFVLLAATAAALAWANVDPSGYASTWDTALRLEVGDYTFQEDLRHLVSDGLMALFFLVIGLEIKRELILGELRGLRRAALPVFAAIGGMALPAAIYLAVVGLRGGEGMAGWGIPMATDVAFAVGLLAALGGRVPSSLAAFLLGIAVVDDIGAILVVAIVYSDGIAAGWLAAAVGALALTALLARLGIRYLPPYVALALIAWLCTYESGVHATIAGVAIGLLTPAHPFQDPAAVSAEAHRIADVTADDPEDPDEDAYRWRRLAWLSREAISPLRRVEHGLHEWSSYVVLPLFALASAGIVLDADALTAARDSGVALAVAVGLVAGKAGGILLGALVAVRLGVALLPDRVRWPHVAGVGGLAGIGFTVAIFIAGLAFPDGSPLEDAAKIGVLAGSVAAAALGVAVLLAVSRRDASAG